MCTHIVNKMARSVGQSVLVRTNIYLQQFATAHTQATVSSVKYTFHGLGNQQGSGSDLSDNLCTLTGVTACM
jgi:hypothetical protein